MCAVRACSWLPWSSVWSICLWPLMIIHLILFLQIRAMIGATVNPILKTLLN